MNTVPNEPTNSLDAASEPVAPTTIGGNDGPVRIPQLADGYELHDEIAEGGIGIVYRARDLALNREVAVKTRKKKFPLDGAGGAAVR